MSSQQAEPDVCERERVVITHGQLVEREAARYRTWHIDRADLRQAGILGLLIAASRFDPEHGAPFAAYAHAWVRKEIQRTISQQEFPAVVPTDLIGRTVALRRALDENAASLNLAAAALGISPTTIAALHRRADAPAVLGIAGHGALSRPVRRHRPGAAGRRVRARCRPPGPLPSAQRCQRV